MLGVTSVCGITRTDIEQGPRELTGIVDLTRGEDHPGPLMTWSQAWHRA